MSLFSLGFTYFRTRLLLLMSAVAIALGVAVLFTVLAVMNGFLAELEGTIRSLSGDAVIETTRTMDPTGHDLEEYRKLLLSVDGVEEIK